MLVLSAADQNAGETFTWTVTQKPSFVTVVSTNDTLKLQVTPNYTDAGTYTVQVKVTDSRGAIDTKTFTLTIEDRPTPNYKLFINIKFNQNAPAPWNNVTGQTTNSLKNDRGETTTANLVFDTYWWGTYSEGAVTGNNSGLYPDVVMSEFLYFGTLPGVFNAPSSIPGKLTGLETNRTYTVKFFGSSKWGAPQPNNGTTNYTINGVTKPLFVHNNTANAVIFENITPNASGEIAFTLAVPAGGQVGFLNAIEVNANGAGGGEPPVNNAPVLTAIANQSVQEGTTKDVAISAVDPDNDPVTYSLLGAPAFVTIVNGNVHLAPAAGNSGTFNNIRVIATDSKNAADTISFNLTVTPAGVDPAYKIFVNIKANSTAPAPWNNVTGQTTNSLVNDLGATTTANLIFDTWWWGTHNEGAVTGNNSGAYPDAVISDFLYFGTLPGIFSAPNTISGRITGLPTNRLYSVKFFSSSKWWAPSPDNGTTNFTIGGVTKSLYVHNNTTNLVVFSNLVPDANGVINFTMAVPAGGQAGFLNAIEINAGESGGAPPVNHAPELTSINNQAVTAGTTTNVNITATDPDGDNLSYSLLNAPSFVTIVGNQVRIAPAAGNTGTYNAIKLVATDPQGLADTVSFNLEVTPVGAMPGYKFLISMKFQNTIAAPWNNAAGQTTSNLVNTLGETTTASLVFDTYWWGTYNEGAVTGNNSGVYPDAVMAEFLYFGTLPGVFSAPNSIPGKLTGLDPTRTYSLKFFGSSKWWAPSPDNGSTNYTINGVTKSLYVHNNTANVVTFDNLTPNANGEISFVMAVPTGGQVGFLNAIEVDVAATGGTQQAQTVMAARTANIDMAITKQETVSNFTLTAYPNPVRDMLAVDIELVKSTSVVIEFVDVFGRPAYKEVKTNLPAGKTTLRYNTANFLTGKSIYMIRISTPSGENKVVKIIKQ